MNDNNVYIEFHYVSFSLEPYSNEIASSSKLLKEVIYKLNHADYPSAKRIKDRHENRSGTEKRRLVHISSPFEELGRRCFGKIALIKNKAPMTWGGKDIIEEIQKPTNQEFIEVTNYVINFNENSNPVIMVEFNSAGPRISDIEYYFRQVCKEYRIAKSVKSSIHLNISYNTLETNLDNVFSITVKVNSQVHQKANWLKALKNLSDESGYKDVRLELSYQRKKDLLGKSLKNIRGLDYARSIITWLKSKPNNIDSLDDLKMAYSVNGNEEVIDLDFLKNKTTSYIGIPKSVRTLFTLKDFKHHVGQEFNNYLKTGKTTIETD